MPSDEHRKNVAIFVDVQNIFYTTRQIHGCNFDYNTFWRVAASGREVISATAYAIDRGDEKQRQFQNILRAIGFAVKLKPFIQRADGSAKGDWDVGLTIDVIECCAQATGAKNRCVDVVVLASGDGDFDLLVRHIMAKHGVEVEVYGVAELTADSLIAAASRFVAIEGELLLAAGKK
jgi:uncharacterized LabA/DUF88 family protein